MSAQPQISPPPGGAAALFAPNPNVAQLTPEQMQGLVDQAGNFNLYSMPEGGANTPIYMPGDSCKVIGVKVREALHRFSVVTQAPTAYRPLTARNVIGERVATFSHRWLFAPHDFVGTVDDDPPPTVFDPSVSQRLVMRDSVCKFNNGEDGFRGFGAGKTITVTSSLGQPKLYAVMVGTLVEGFGKFKGNEEGTYVYCGSFSPTMGFLGNIMLRVIDRRGVLRNDLELPLIEEHIENPEPHVIYVLFRGQAVPTDAVTPTQTGLIVQQGLRLYDIDMRETRRGPETSDATGKYMGNITANINFNPAYPGGGPLNPIPFTNHDEFDFNDSYGPSAGSFTAESSEGRVFLTQVGGQGAIRFGGVGTILGGKGPFEGIRGLMTDNSVVVFAPHVSASIYVLRIDDPEYRFHSDRRQC